MNNFYNSAMYLKTSDLNNIEDDIESITNDVQEMIFDNQQSPLRNIQVGDNLNGKTIYLLFPKDIESTTSRISIITTGNLATQYTKRIFFEYSNNVRRVYIITFDIKNGVRVDKTQDIYYKSDNSYNPSIYCMRFKLPNNFGVVSNINTTDGLNEYIKIYDDENIIPNYIKHTWVDDEPLSMQKIDNIERGIKNIGDYYYKPQGWLKNKEWLETSDFNEIYPNINNKFISYQDLNRWVNNLSLIDFDDLYNICLWNTDISNLQWNRYTNTEWEEY